MAKQDGSVFDYIVVGGGSAGCVLAERLTRDGRASLLLIEEGPSDKSWLLKMPKGFGQVLGRAHYSATFPARREGMSDENWIRGRTLGGSSSVNGMTWIRCQHEDFDSLAQDNPGWSWAEMEPYFDALDGGGDGSGIIKVNVQPSNNPAIDAFIAAGARLGLPVKQNLNAGEQEGVGLMTANIDSKGRRSSAATGFLKRARGRTNLHVVTGLQVDRVILRNGRAVSIIGNKNGASVSYSARAEIILSAGGIGSPMILQRSGIGNPALLDKLGIEVKKALPGVGQNLSEHLLLSLNFKVKSWAFSENRQYGGLRLLLNLAKYLAARTGPMARPPYAAAAFTRTRAALNRPDVQLMFAPWSRPVRTFDPFPGINIFGYQLRPESRGFLNITSADPNAPPEIETNYLASPVDQEVAVAIVRSIREIARQLPLADLIVQETGVTAGAKSDNDILRAFRENARTGCHATGTCSMGSSPDAVIDARTRVHGIEHLRVVDASIYPAMLSGNLNAPTQAVAMRAAELILEDQNKVRGEPDPSPSGG